MKTNIKIKIGSLVTILFLIGYFGSVWAAYPDRPITMVCPYAGVEYTIRPFADYLEKALGQPVIILTKAGASASIGAGFIAKARPDGYTIGQITHGPLTMAPHIYDSIPYDPFNSFDFIVGYGKYEYGPCVRSDSPFKTLKDLLDYAKQNPGKLKYATVGLATPTHFGMVQMAKLAGIKWEIVVFKDVPGTVTAVLGGHLPIIMQPPLTVAPLIKSGQLRLLASFSDTRWKWVPDVPTVRELGYDFDVVSRMGFGAPKGVPKEIMDKLREVFKQACSDPEVMKKYDQMYIPLKYLSPEDYVKSAEKAYKENEALFLELGLHKSQKKK
jgi:tripartite-type tricarboxylate transporter receptor subunit TctC